MKYNFRNTKTNEIVVKEYSMAEVPKEFKENGVLFKRDYNLKSGAGNIIIPRHMRAGNY